MKYLCLIYSSVLDFVPVSRHPQLAEVALVSARDLNRAVDGACGLLCGPGEAAVIRRIVAGNPKNLGDNNNWEIAMKYLCLVYSDENQLHSLPDSPEDSECQAYAESVAGTGRMLAAEALEPVNSATTVRLRSGKVTITDGPFAETKEQLAGFYLVDAHNLDEALEIAAGIPAARVGSVEVRPVRELQV